ncbi:MAG: Fic family protein [Actinomycetota bacterium]
MIGLMLIREGRLSNPVLYLSGYFESHRSEYYDRLQGVRENGAINEWLLFFLRAVQDAAEDAVSRASRLIELRESYLANAQTERSRVGVVIPLIFKNPFVSANAVQRTTDVTAQGARNLLSRAEALGWVKKYGTYGQGRRMLWIANDVLDVLVDPQTYAEEASADAETTQS